MNTPQTQPLMLSDLAYEDIKTGDRFSFTRFISEADVEHFAGLTGDQNPLHTDRQYAEATEFKEPIIHGMLLGSLFSTLVGMVCPGKRALYLHQELSFRKPLHPDTQVTVSAEVLRTHDATRVVELKTAITDHTGAAVVDGTARVHVRR